MDAMRWAALLCAAAIGSANPPSEKDDERQQILRLMGCIASAGNLSICYSFWDVDANSHHSHSTTIFDYCEVQDLGKHSQWSLPSPMNIQEASHRELSEAVYVIRVYSSWPLFTLIWLDLILWIQFPDLEASWSVSLSRAVVLSARDF